MAGGLNNLAEVLRNYWAKTDTGASIDAIVNSACEAISLASDSLKRVRQFGEKNSDPAATKASIWLNSVLFKELLAVQLDPSTLPQEFQLIGISRPDLEQGATHLAQQWKTILEINWFPTFHVARERLNRIPGGIATLALDVLEPSAKSIADARTNERHDIAGRILHRLLDTRKCVATNYTTIPSAILLVDWHWMTPIRYGKDRTSVT